MAIVAVLIQKLLELMIMIKYLHVKGIAIKCSKVKINLKIIYSKWKALNLKKIDLFIYFCVFYINFNNLYHEI